MNNDGLSGWGSHNFLNHWGWWWDNNGLGSSGDLAEVGVPFLDKNLSRLPEVGHLNNLGIELVGETGILVLDIVERVGDGHILGVGIGEIVRQGVVHLIKVLDLGLIGIA